MEGQTPDPRTRLEQMAGQADAMVDRVDSTPSVNPESEQQEAREKMSALIDKLDAGVMDKGVIAYVVGTKDDTGDQRAAILTEPTIHQEGNQRYVEYVVLTPDGPMVLDGVKAGNSFFQNIANNNLAPEDYQGFREVTQGLRYKAEKMGTYTSHRLDGRVGFEDVTYHLTPPENSRTNPDVSRQFEQSLKKAAKPLEARRNQAANTSILADSLASKL